MLRAIFQLPLIERDNICQRASGIALRAAEDRIAFRCFGPVRRVFPAGAGVQDDALVEPVFRGGAGGGDDADAVGE